MKKLLLWLAGLFKKKLSQREKEAKFNAAFMVANEGKIGAEMIATQHVKQLRLKDNQASEANKEGTAKRLEFAEMVAGYIDEIPHEALIEVVDYENKRINVNRKLWT